MSSYSLRKLTKHRVRVGGVFLGIALALYVKDAAYLLSAIVGGDLKDNASSLSSRNGVQ